MSFPTLQDHRKHIHEVHAKEYHPCPTCGKIFSAPSMLERHMVTHVGGKPFSCGICNKAYQVTSRALGALALPPNAAPFGLPILWLMGHLSSAEMTAWLVLMRVQLIIVQTP